MDRENSEDLRNFHWWLRVNNSKKPYAKNKSYITKLARKTHLLRIDENLTFPDRNFSMSFLQPSTANKDKPYSQTSVAYNRMQVFLNSNNYQGYRLHQ